MQHARQLDVGDLVELAEHLGRHVEALRRLADDLVGAGRLRLRWVPGEEIAWQRAEQMLHGGGARRDHLVGEIERR